MPSRSRPTRLKYPKVDRCPTTVGRAPADFDRGRTKHGQQQAALYAMLPVAAERCEPMFGLPGARRLGFLLNESYGARHATSLVGCLYG